jgi:hypothetical protein
MRFPRPLSSRAWIIVPLLAVVFLFWIDSVRSGHVGDLTRLAGGAAAPVDAASPTGYAGGIRELIVPEHNNDSYQWIAQTQQMLARGEWRVRHVNYDNAPEGRAVYSPSPYRWWLGAVAWIDHAWSGRPVGLSVERAALYADPALHLLLLLGTVIFVARRFGAFPAALLSAGLAAAFPFAGSFLPGEPSDHGLAAACALWSVLPLLAGIGASRAAAPPADDAGAANPFAAARRRRQRWFFIAGLIGAFGLWIDVASEAPILTGVFLGGIATTALARRQPAGGRDETEESLPWRMWAGGGAVGVFVFYLVEYFPGSMTGLRLEQIHPLYGLAWLGGGELLARWNGSVGRKAFAWTLRQGWILGCALLAVVAVPAVMMVTHNPGFLADDFLASRLTNLPNGPAAANLVAWLQRDGVTLAFIATCLPLLCVGPAVWLLARPATAPRPRAAVALALGPVIVALGLACTQLRWWNLLDSALFALLVAMTAMFEGAARSARGRWWGTGAAVLSLVPGIMLLVPRAGADGQTAVTETEVESLIERDLAHWLANQAGPDSAIVLASPSLTTSLYFHGGLRGVGTPYRENKAGLIAAIRIAGATSQDEALALSRKRSLTYMVVASWDPVLDDSARRTAGKKPEAALFSLLHRWQPPRWLQPVPYRLPQIAGFEDQSVAIFKVVDVQDNATALSHLAGYFIEMGRLDFAAAVGETLQQSFPADLGAAIARAQIALARPGPAAHASAIDPVLKALARGDDRALAWDRRVSLAIVLAQVKRFDLARTQMQRCLAELTEPRLRSLTAVSLYRFQVLAKAFGLGISDPQLRTVARNLVPAELRSEL